MEERLPTTVEAAKLRELTQGMLPAHDFSRQLFKSLCRAGWIYAARSHYATSTIYYAINDSGMVALQRSEETQGKGV